MQPVNNNPNANSNSNAANANSNSNAANANSNSNAYKVTLSQESQDLAVAKKRGRRKNRAAKNQSAKKAVKVKAVKVNNDMNKRKSSRSKKADKARQTEISSPKQDQKPADNQIRIKLTDQKEQTVLNLFDKFTEKNTQTIKTVGGNKTEQNTQVAGNPDEKTPAASEQIVITAPKGPMIGLKAEDDSKSFNIPALKNDDGNTEDSKESEKIGNVPDLFKEKDNNGIGSILGKPETPLGIGNNGNDKSNGPPGLLKKDDDDDKPNGPPGLLKKEDDDDKGPVAIGKYRNKNKEPVGLEKKDDDDKDDKIHGKPDTVQEIKGALSKMQELMEELREKSSKSESDSADEQKSYSFGAGMVSLNTSESLQTSSKPTYGRSVGAAKGSAIHINDGSDSKSDRSDTTIENKGSFSLGSLTNRAGALSTYSQIQDIA